MGCIDIQGPMTVPVFVLHLAARQRTPGEHRQDLLANGVPLAKFRQQVEGRQYYDFGGYLVGRNLEASRPKFSPVVLSLVLVVLGMAGTFFNEMLTAQIKP